ncbi:MAG: hypothetical protein KDI51_00980, partial [Xanthomonadales bacterium]|nr:hypothetical protein [Xanthomonadales bacterium]
FRTFSPVQSMALTALILPTPIRRRPTLSKRNYDLRDQAIEAHERGEYLQAVELTLAFLLPEQSSVALHEEALCLLQGSARVRIECIGERLRVRALLAELPAQGRATAGLRYFLGRLSSTGQLFQPRLRGEQIALEFEDDLALLHPQKLIEVLQRLPLEADSHDAWLAEQFQLQMPDRAPLTSLSESEWARAWEVWTTHWAAIDELMVESRRRRSLRFLDALGSLAVNQVRYLLPLHGGLRAELAEHADIYTDQEEDPNRRDAALARCIKAMRQVEPARLQTALGHASYAFSPLQEGTVSMIASMLGPHRLQGTGELRTGGRHLEAALELIADFVYLLTYQIWPEPLEQALREALDQASGKPWREVADLLWHQAAQINRAHGQADEDERAEELESLPYE